MNRRLIVARIISVTGSLLLIVAAIHLLVTPALKSAILDRVLTTRIADCLPTISAQSYCCRHSNHPHWIHYYLYCFGNTCWRTVGVGNQPCHWAYHPQPAGRARPSDARGVFPRRSISTSSRSDNNGWDYNDGGANISGT